MHQLTKFDEDPRPHLAQDMHLKQLEEKLHITKQIGHIDLWHCLINLSSSPKKYLLTGFDDPCMSIYNRGQNIIDLTNTSYNQF